MGILAGDYLINNWRPDLVERVMAYLSPDNVRVTVLTKNAKFFARYVKGSLISEDISIWSHLQNNEQFVSFLFYLH